MCASTNTMKMTPLAAIRSFSAMVERVERAPLTRVVVATKVTLPPARTAAVPRGV